MLTDWQSLIPCRSTVSSERHVNPSSPDPYTTSSTLGDLLLTARVAQKCNSNLSSNILIVNHVLSNRKKKTRRGNNSFNAFHYNLCCSFFFIPYQVSIKAFIALHTFIFFIISELLCFLQKCIVPLCFARVSDSGHSLYEKGYT